MIDGSSYLSAAWWRIKEVVAERIAALNLDGVGRRVYNQPSPDLSQIQQHAGVLVTSENERIGRLPGTTEHKDWLFPVRVFFVDRDVGIRGAKESAWMDRQQQVLDEFDQKPLHGVPGPLAVYACEAEPGVAYDPEAEAYRYMVGSALLKFYTRFPR